MASSVSRRWVSMGGAAAAATWLSGCKIVPIGEGTSPAKFDASSYAGELWTERALPHFSSATHPLPEVIAAIATDLQAAGTKYGYRPSSEGSPWTFVVSGSGRVLSKNTESRAGTLTVALDGAQPPGEIDIQIGPVVRGNAVRDALPFVSFKDFTNQLEFADVGKALTALALGGVSTSAAAIEPGQQVTFTGAMSIRSAGDKPVVTPVTLAAATP